jgi:hypothetical protein
MDHPLRSRGKSERERALVGVLKSTRKSDVFLSTFIVVVFVLPHGLAV